MYELVITLILAAMIAAAFDVGAKWERERSRKRRRWK